MTGDQRKDASTPRVVLPDWEIELIERAVAAQFGHRYPRPKHWKRAAALRGFFSVWPAPRWVWRWIEDNSLQVPEAYRGNGMPHRPGWFGGRQ